MSVCCELFVNYGWHSIECTRTGADMKLASLPSLFLESGITDVKILGAWTRIDQLRVTRESIFVKEAGTGIEFQLYLLDDQGSPAYVRLLKRVEVR